MCYQANKKKQAVYKANGANKKMHIFFMVFYFIFVQQQEKNNKTNENRK